MRLIIITIIILIKAELLATPRVVCQVSQESLRETELKIEHSPKFVLTPERNKNQYLKTVLTRLEASIDGPSILVALKNNFGEYRKRLQLKERLEGVGTFEFPSDIPGGIRNKVLITCSE